MPSTISIAAFERWVNSAAKLIGEVKDENLPPTILDAIASVVPFKFATAYVYTGQCKPYYVYDTFRQQKAKQGIANYIDNTYILNPVYIAYLNGVKQGVYRIGDLAPDEYFEGGHYHSLKVSITEEEELGYITEDWPRGMEEVVMMVDLPDKCMGEISLLQPVGDGGFSEDDINKLISIQAVIRAAFNHYWLLINTHPDFSRPPDSYLDDALSRFGIKILTPREREITHYVLRGHSSISIGMHLEISVTTVKTHRKHIYAKFSIGSQVELFSLFINYLMHEQSIASQPSAAVSG